MLRVIVSSPPTAPRTGSARSSQRIPGSLLFALAALLLTAAAPVLAQDEEALPTREELETCVRANLPSEPGQIDFALQVFDRTGEAKDLNIEMLWDVSPDDLRSTRLRVTAPENVAGSMLLTVEKARGQPDLFVALPELKRVRKIRSRRLRGSVLGTDVNFEELHRLQRKAEDAQVNVVGAETLGSRKVWKVEATPGNPNRSSYERVVSFVDRETCVPLRIDFYEAEGEPIKRLAVDATSLTRHGDYTIPHAMTMHDLQNETRTAIRVESVNVPAEFPEGTFTRDALVEERQAVEAN